MKVVSLYQTKENIMKNQSQLEHLQYQRNIAYNNGDMQECTRLQALINDFTPQYK